MKTHDYKQEWADRPKIPQNNLHTFVPLLVIVIFWLMTPSRFETDNPVASYKL
jgi:hypothetical protein